MATIDTSKIDGFDAMTPEQKVDALMKAEIPDPVDMTGYVSKSDSDAKIAALEKKVADMEKATKRDKAIAEYTTEYIALGYDKDTAAATATAAVDGDIKTVLANQRKHEEDVTKKHREEDVNNTPKPAGFGGAGGKEEDTAVAMAKRLAQSRGGLNGDIGAEYAF